MFFRRRRRGGSGLIKLLIIGGLLYYTGAGAWLWNRVKQLPEACFDLMASSGFNSGGAVCDGAGSLIKGVDEGAGGLIDTVKGWLGQASDKTNVNLDQFSQGLFNTVGGGQSRLSGLTSTGDRLKDMMNGRPFTLPDSAGAKQQLKAALDQFVIGQHYLQTDSINEALPWFQQSAAQPGGYGVLSQLTLGDMYRTGSSGMPVNVETAGQYYQQAQQSMQMLQQSNSPESKQLLGNLPAEPAVINQQIVQILRSLKQ